ncbi:BURP domain-containing protein BNM2A-like [Andrographis paniculata]|uniref:BURP domain-containing protein BNM2A-like n=1 Tax=Andrographis paniculata TaxID=175694 RepID=UPI0021E9360C|nr:BURP domain-containing protein BNM2A-like [Andrographis paniculata]
MAEAKLFLFHLLILLVGRGASGSSVAILSSPGSIDSRNPHVDLRIEQVRSSSLPHVHHHMDPSVIVFFFLEDLKQGNTLPIHFPKRGSNTSRMLPREEADSIPFSSRDLDYLLRLFSFRQGSPQAVAMEDTLRQCETRAIKGETKLCATSWESMLDFARTNLGRDLELKILSTIHLTRSNTLLQKYTVNGIDEITAGKMMACHTMPYPYGVLYCHYQKSPSKVFKVSLTGENGDKVEAVAVCHMDTSQWSHKHVAFEVLGIEPGSSPVCHFFPEDHFVMVA